MNSIVAWWSHKSSKERGATMMALGTAVMASCIGLLMTMHAADGTFDPAAGRLGVVIATAMAALSLGVFAMGYLAGRRQGLDFDGKAAALERLIGPAALALAVPAFLILKREPSMEGLTWLPYATAFACAGFCTWTLAAGRTAREGA